jgi:hypothetical protein
MGHQEIDVREVSSADIDTVYAVLANSAGWPDWGTMDSFELAKPDADGGQGVGCERVYRTRRFGRTYAVRERIVELVPGRRLSYTLVAGLALRDYRADIDLAPHAGGTAIHWHTTFVAKVPGTGSIYHRALDRFTRAQAKGLAEYAATRATRKTDHTR